MARETHVLRFKVVSVECPALPDGQQYTIMYHRGDTNRSTPCYTAQKGSINFSAMPEGAAVVHFKSGHGGSRYAPKYIRFMIEEYTRGMPRRLVGETEVDCTQAMKDRGSSGASILTVGFRLYSTSAKMTIAVLVYPESMPPLSFDTLIDSSVAPPPASPPPTVKAMSRGEAMMILMGLETMLERRRNMEVEGHTVPQTREEQKLAELEERRKALVGTEGLATEAIKARCEEVVAVQYTALARKHRNNFIGQTAAYLREMAINCGEGFADDDNDDTSSDGTALEQLNRVNRTLDDLQKKVASLEEDQLALGRIQHKVDVTAELCANLDNVTAMQKKMELLQQSRTALTEAVRKQAAKKDSPLSREVAAIKARIAALTAEQEQMRPKIQHMIGVAASHVVTWGRSKNPPEAEVNSRVATKAAGGNGLGRNTVDDLFSNAVAPQKSKEQMMLDDVQRKQVVEALKGLKASAPPPTARSATSASSSSGHRTPRDMFADSGLPTMGDFNKSQKKRDEEAAAAKPAHEDPMRPSGLGMDMFSAKPPPAAASAAPPGLPSTNDFMRPSTTAQQQGSQPVFDFGAIIRESRSASPAAAGDFGGSGGGGGFVLEPQLSDPMFGGGGGGGNTAASPGSPGAPGVTVAYNKADDPYYDEMDDFTVQGAGGDDGNTYGAIEITGGFGGFGEETASPTRPSSANPSAGFKASRPTFDFGPSGGFGGSTGAPSASPAATFSFGAGAADGPAGNNRDSDNPYSGMSALPTYNFGS